MQHVRHIAQLLAVSGCLLWGVYQVTADVSALSNDGRPSAQFTDQDLATMYPDLPLPVAKSVASVVSTQQVLNQKTKQGVVASGVIINDSQILTAGHNVEGGGAVICNQATVIAAGAYSDAAVSKDPVSHASVRYGKGTDMAVLTVQPSDNFRSQPDMRLAKRLPEKGEVLYFINFQPAADGSLRSPAVTVSTDPGRDFSKPAVFSGIYLGDTADGMAVATGYGKSLGRGAPDILARKGASGGAVVNGRGELVGLTVSSASLSADHSSTLITQQYKVRLPQQNYQITHMQPVSKHVIAKLQKDTVTCDKL